MDSKRITSLLEKYWTCETSLEEEKELRDYFNGQDVPEHLSEAANLFRFFEQQRRQSLGAEFDTQVMKSLKKSEKKVKVVSMVSWIQMARIAAGVAVVVAATYFVRNEASKSYADQGDITDPKIALEETKKALMLISKGLGKAKEGAGKINLFNEAEEKITGKKNLKKDNQDKANI